MPDVLWTYRAYLIRVIDGDTIDVELDLGFGLTMGRPGSSMCRLRLEGVDAPEIYGAEASEAGKRAARWTHDWLNEAFLDDSIDLWSLVMQTVKTKPGDERRTLGRYVARVWRVKDGRSLNEDLAAWLKEQGDGS